VSWSSNGLASAGSDLERHRAGSSDESYAAVGARLVICARACLPTLGVKVKEPQRQEFGFLRRVLAVHYAICTWPPITDVGRALLDARQPQGWPTKSVSSTTGNLPLLAPDE